jgi:hypothetical protein
MAIENLFSEFCKLLLKVIPNLPQLNSTARNEFIDTISDLATELQEGLSLVEIYLKGIRYLDDPEEIQMQLSKTQEKLLKYYSEFKICKGLRKLRDRFDRLFDALPMAIKIGSKEEIETLLYELSKDERMIIDEFSSLWNRVSYSPVNPHALPELHKILDEEIRHAKETRLKLSDRARELLDKF